MFTLKKNHTFRWPVEIQVPGNGAFVASGFTGEFLALDQDRINELYIGKPASEGAPAVEGGDRGLLRVALIGWSEIQDEDGKPVPFSEEGREALLGIEFIRRGIA